MFWNSRELPQRSPHSPQDSKIRCLAASWDRFWVNLFISALSFGISTGNDHIPPSVKNLNQLFPSDHLTDIICCGIQISIPELRELLGTPWGITGIKCNSMEFTDFHGYPFLGFPRGFPVCEQSKGMSVIIWFKYQERVPLVLQADDDRGGRRLTHDLISALAPVVQH